MERAILTGADEQLRTVTAWHEAGHAVMAHLCGQIVTGIEIEGDLEHSGSVSSLRLVHSRDATDGDLRTVRLETRILCLVAGFAAEAMITGEWDWSSAEEEDLNEAVRLALRVVGRCDRVQHYLEEARDHAVDLLHRNWPAVKAVAGELLARGRLSGEQFRVILESWELVS